MSQDSLNDGGPSVHASAVKVGQMAVLIRGPSGSGLGNGTHPPVAWDAAKGTNILWTTEIPGLANSSPVVWGDRVFLTSVVSKGETEAPKKGLYFGGERPVWRAISRSMSPRSTSWPPRI